VAWSFYGPMLQQLQTQLSGDVYAVGYDWRQDIQWLGGYAAEKIQGILNETQAEKVVVVTHSMGGLVLRSALLSGALASSSLAALVHICIPAAGAVNLYRRMFTGMVLPFDGGGSLGDRAFRLILGNNRKGFVGNISGLPGAAELLPSGFFPPDSHGAFWNPGLTTQPVGDLYSSGTSPPGLSSSTLGLTPDVLADLKDRISDVASFQSFFGDPGVSLHPETWLIYGTAQSTETHIAFQSGVAIPGIDNLGDGTVPQISAMALKLDSSKVLSANVEHSMACADATVIGHVADILPPYL
jgi:hypothetical protein